MMSASPVVSIWSYEGRSSRSDYLVVLLITSVLGSISGTIMVKVGGGFRFFSGIFFCAVMWVSMCACARRMHDVGRSGWWSLVALVPVGNLFFGLYALFAPGQEHDNDFGPSLMPAPTQSLSAQELSAHTSLEPRVHISQSTLAPVTVNAEMIPQMPEPSEVADVDPMEEFWAQALHECDSAAMKAGLWAKAFADAQGQEAMAKAQYIRLRAVQLQKEHMLLLEAEMAEKKRAQQVELIKQQELKAERAAVLAKLNEEELSEALKPKGRCPNCSALINADSEICPECHADFSSGSAWQVKPLTGRDRRMNLLVQQQVRSLMPKENAENSDDSMLPDIVLYVGVILLFLLLFSIFK